MLRIMKHLNLTSVSLHFVIPSYILYSLWYNCEEFILEYQLQLQAWCAVFYSQTQRRQRWLGCSSFAVLQFAERTSTLATTSKQTHNHKRLVVVLSNSIQRLFVVAIASCNLRTIEQLEVVLIVNWKSIMKIILLLCTASSVRF